MKPGGETGGNVVDFLKMQDERLTELEREVIEQGFVYARGGLKELCFPNVYFDMAQKYFHDTDVLIADVATSSGFPEGSQMTIGRGPKGAGGHESSWRRIMILHPNHLEHNNMVLSRALEASEVTLDETITTRLAQILAVFSQVAGVASEAAYVVNKHTGKYIVGFNGHSPHFNAHQFMSQAYKQRHPEQAINVEQDTMQLRYGMSFYLLGGFLESTKILGRGVQTAEFIESLIAAEQQYMQSHQAVALDEARAFPLNFRQILERVRDVPLPEAARGRVNRVSKNPSRYRGFFVVKNI